ncbi:hypothetical protein AGMMS50256_31190 [Betaproteobacteria bacterium]|nr:hypothetical protein AGMMS50256_31190 [Betaproteobacteria bacterium]
MRSVGIISVTINAAAPLLANLGPLAVSENWKLRNYLDEGLQDLVQREGRVTPASIARLMRMIGDAVEDGSDVILLSCTVFSPYIDTLQILFSTPVIGADCAMLKQAVSLQKRTAILCTFPATVETSERLFRSEAGISGFPCDVSTFLLEEAATAFKSGDRQKHDQIIADTARNLAQDFGAIVLAQISMAPAAALLTDLHVPVLTSPACVASVLKALLE